MQYSGRSYYNFNALKCRIKALMMQVVQCMIGPDKIDLCFAFWTVNLISENMFSSFVQN